MKVTPVSVNISERAPPADMWKFGTAQFTESQKQSATNPMAMTLSDGMMSTD
jgi:hypothetical protein